MTRSIQRREALRLLEGESAILATARELSAILRAAGIEAPVIGGVAVVLHGHVRTTVDVDLFVQSQEAERLRSVLEAAGFEFDPQQRQFTKSGIPVHRVMPQQTR